MRRTFFNPPALLLGCLFFGIALHTIAQHPMPSNLQQPQNPRNLQNPQIVPPVVTQPAPVPSPVVENIQNIAPPVTATPVPAPVAVPDLPPVQPAQVLYSQGSLTVIADDASLNQTLREISHATGVKINGSVVEDRVYGTYGPGPPADVLASLLDGSGSNYVFSHVNSAAGELTLTPITGGVTPASAYPTASFDDDDSGGPQPQYQPPPEQQPVQPSDNTPPPAPQDVTNGVLTPQQVADRLAQMQQQRQQQLQMQQQQLQQQPPPQN
jgi:hypothetical protein